MTAVSHVKHQRPLRITGFALLAFILFWLPIEDNATRWPVFLALLSGIWLGAFLFYLLVWLTGLVGAPGMPRWSVRSPEQPCRSSQLP